MIYTEQVGVFSEARTLLPRLLRTAIVLNLMLLHLGPGDARNSFDVIICCALVSPSFFWAEAIFVANSTHWAGEICVLQSV